MYGPEQQWFEDQMDAMQAEHEHQMSAEAEYFAQMAAEEEQERCSEEAYNDFVAEQQLEFDTLPAQTVSGGTATTRTQALQAATTSADAVTSLPSV